MLILTITLSRDAPDFISYRTIMKQIKVCVGTSEGKSIRARLSLLFIDDDSGAIMSRHFHSSQDLLPGDDAIAEKLRLEADICSPQSGVPGAPWPKIPDAEWNEVLAIVNTLHTPERVAARRERDRKNAELLAAQAAPGTR